MLFMNSYSWDPAKRDEIIARRVEKGTLAPEGLKVVGEFKHLSNQSIYQGAEVV